MTKPASMGKKPSKAKADQQAPGGMLHVARRVEIYALVDPETDRVRYIGKAVDSAARLKTHVRDSRRRTTPVLSWIRGLVSRGRLPDVLVIDTPELGGWQAAERHWIARARERGVPLLNLADGGDAPGVSREQCQAGAAATNRARASSPAWVGVQRLKLGMGAALRAARRRKDWGAAYSIRFRVMVFAASLPGMAGWAAELR